MKKRSYTDDELVRSRVQRENDFKLLEQALALPRRCDAPHGITDEVRRVFTNMCWQLQHHLLVLTRDQRSWLHGALRLARLADAHHLAMNPSQPHLPAEPRYRGPKCFSP